MSLKILFGVVQLSLLFQEHPLTGHHEKLVVNILAVNSEVTAGILLDLSWVLQDIHYFIYETANEFGFLLSGNEIIFDRGNENHIPFDFLHRLLHFPKFLLLGTVVKRVETDDSRLNTRISSIDIDIAFDLADPVKVLS